MAVAERISRPGPEHDPTRAERRSDAEFARAAGALDAAFLTSEDERAAEPLGRSPLTRRIVAFNLVSLNVLAAGILWLDASRDTLAELRISGMRSEMALIAQMFDRPERDAPLDLVLAETAAQLDLQDGAFGLGGARIISFFGPDGNLRLTGPDGRPAPLAAPVEDGTLIARMIDAAWDRLSPPHDAPASAPLATHSEILAALVSSLDGVRPGIEIRRDEAGITHIYAAAPILRDGARIGTLGIVTEAGEIDHAIREDRERVLQMFVIATLVSIGLSLILAAAIAQPISDLAEAAEAGRDRNRQPVAPARIRIPDLTDRRDEIGRLSGALRGMVAALYDRIERNEQFAADVSHEIKNPLASMRSAVGSLRMVQRDTQRTRLLDILEHDVCRLDRLVTDISNASRLDADLVKEEACGVDVTAMVSRITELLSEEARRRGIELITDLPDAPVVVQGLEARLAQVVVNLVSNAISFCEDGDAIRAWVRQRESRVLLVVEDTGPGIPEEALNKVFARFYTSRPQSDFGNNSGLGLAISRQIVEAHGGVIWAENIQPTAADATSEPLGARLVVGLPV